jgi:large subunit ribosomal protein L25
MEMVELKASLRSQTGKKGVKAYRKQGLLPGILYGKKHEPAPVAVDPKDLNRVLHTASGSNVIIKLSVDGGSREAATVVVKELQMDTIKGVITHVDFCHISLDETIRTTVPFEMVGEAPGVKQGGILEHSLWELEIESLPLNIPNAIRVDVSGLEMGDALMVSDLVIPEGIKVLSDPETSVVTIVAPKGEPAVEAAVAPVEGAEPEVIGAKAEKESEEEAPEKAEEKKSSEKRKS